MSAKKILSLLVLCCSVVSLSAWAVDVGEHAPALTAKTLNGETFDLQAEAHQVVIVNFWASWRRLAVSLVEERRAARSASARCVSVVGVPETTNGLRGTGSGSGTEFGLLVLSARARGARASTAARIAVRAEIALSERSVLCGF